jgi:hypothetical protein
MSKFNICIIQPTGYVHSLAFLELAELILHSLIDLGHKSFLTFNQIDNHATNIIIGCHLLDPTRAILLPSDTIIINTEQLDGNESPWRTAILEWGRRFVIWDYSTKNIHWFSENGIYNAKHLRIGYQRQLERLKTNAPKNIDILFYGCINQRRLKILNELENTGLCVKHLFGIYGSDRDRWIERSQLVLNVHYYASQIFEIVRVFYLITNSVAVISEINKTTSIDIIYKPAIESCPYTNLTNRVTAILNQPTIIQELRQKAHAEISKYPQKHFTEILLTKLS